MGMASCHLSKSDCDCETKMILKGRSRTKEGWRTNRIRRLLPLCSSLSYHHRRYRTRWKPSRISDMVITGAPHFWLNTPHLLGFASQYPGPLCFPETCMKVPGALPTQRVPARKWSGIDNKGKVLVTLCVQMTQRIHLRVVRLLHPLCSAL